MNLLLAGVLAISANADCKECNTFSANVNSVGINSVGITARNKDGRFKLFKNKLRRGR